MGLYANTHLDTTLTLELDLMSNSSTDIPHPPSRPNPKPFPDLKSVPKPGYLLSVYTAMDALAVSGLQLSPVKDFDQIVEIRAEKHAHLRGRNNVTSCRSPTREFNTKLMKNELKEKRHQEFLRRRSVWSEQVTPTRQEKGHARMQASTSTHHWTPNSVKENQKLHIQSENILPKKIVREASVQTESGLVTVKESDVQRLAGYLQEALWREEAVKKKLAVLQESTSNLMNSSNNIWTTHCSEDLLRNKIKALEAQLQVCLQKFPKDGVKKLVLQMEKQKLVYEEKALVALQKATQEKTEALTKAETMQPRQEALRWQSLYEELKLSSGQLQEIQLLSNEQLQQLHSQVELSRAREAELRQEALSLTQEKRELQYNIYLLKEDNQMLREEIQHLRGKTLNL
ncbi:TRAF3-interacting JNK-activating modulator [Collichthys lucidus]|uniref:TRAF3-interacting JNK-activating modulator n=1 Tax=Collichthys lucidus TaxID=240159 RepID=A0A4U5UQY8_COLLU|nr:TRAF3-interacting JNK-activating modulator [Collichthys lucidus]